MATIIPTIVVSYTFAYLPHHSCQICAHCEFPTERESARLSAHPPLEIFIQRARGSISAGLNVSPLMGSSESGGHSGDCSRVSRDVGDGEAIPRKRAVYIKRPTLNLRHRARTNRFSTYIYTGATLGRVAFLVPLRPHRHGVLEGAAAGTRRRAARRPGSRSERRRRTLRRA